jgi:hypothetical protein
LPGTINAGVPAFSVVAGAVLPVSKAGIGGCWLGVGGLPDRCMLQSDPVKGRSQFGYLVNVPKAGSYEVKFNLDSRHKAQGATAQFYVDQQPQGGVITMPASPAGTPGQVAPFTITLSAGISLIELEATSGAFEINTMVVTAKN